MQLLVVTLRTVLFEQPLDERLVLLAVVILLGNHGHTQTA
jgi:hypothetical protein